MRIIDRYVIRQVLMPFCIGLVVFTFVFIIQTLMEHVEPLIAKGVSGWLVFRVLVLLIPQALALSIPTALLLGLLVAFGRLSSQREFVALQACGVSLRRLLYPVGVLSIAAWAATSYVMLVAVPDSNQAFRALTFRIIAERAEGEVRPRQFFDDFPNLVLYVRDIPPSGGGWNGVFLADLRANERAVYVARHGSVRVDQAAGRVELSLEDGIRYAQASDSDRIFRFGRLDIRVDPTAQFPAGEPEKSEREMSIAELRAKIAYHEALNISTHNQVMAIHQKFAIPVACLVFGIIGLALGATNRRDGALGSFGLGIAVVFAYYIPLFLFPQLTKGGYVPPWLAVWLPNILLGVFALALFARRNQIVDQPLGLPAWVKRVKERAGRRRITVRARGPLRMLDQYVTRMFVRVLLLTLAACLAVFYISTFIDLSDKLFKGDTPWYAILEYFFFASGQFAYYILPLSVLIATLVTVGLLTGSSELVAMKACGVSLYRVAVPMLVCAALVGGTLLAMDATFLGESNRRADVLRDRMRGKTTISMHQAWTMGDDGSIYHVRAYDRRQQELAEIDVWRLDAAMSRLLEQTSARRANLQGDPGRSTQWELTNGWTREFDLSGESRAFRTFTSVVRDMEAPEHFAQEPPDSEFMSLPALRHYTNALTASGIDVLEHQVELERKLAFPFVTIIMTLIAIPFGVTIGRSGTMAGIGVGVALALLYWGIISISVALGKGGALPPMVAAWAPNLLFASGASYLLLTVRT